MWTAEAWSSKTEIGRFNIRRVDIYWVAELDDGWSRKRVGTFDSLTAAQVACERYAPDATREAAQ